LVARLEHPHIVFPSTTPGGTRTAPTWSCGCCGEVLSRTC
jgi:hypothetical protein